MHFFWGGGLFLISVNCRFGYIYNPPPQERNVVSQDRGVMVLTDIPNSRARNAKFCIPQAIRDRCNLRMALQCIPKVRPKQAKAVQKQQSPAAALTQGTRPGNWRSVCLKTQANSVKPQIDHTGLALFCILFLHFR